MKLSIIANPVAGRGRAYGRLKRYLDRWSHPDWEIEVLPTRCPEHAGEIAHELVSNPPDVVAVCGGDGTLSEVASRVPDPPFPVALIPSGTANVLARELSIPTDLVAALETALARRSKRVDLGVLSGRSERRFLLMAGIGFDAFVVSRVRPALKARLGLNAYVMNVLRAVRDYPMIPFHVIVEGESYPATGCVVANSKGYGGGLLFNPGADLCDGMLDLVMIQGKSRLAYVRFIAGARLGKPPALPCVRRCRARKVRIEGPRGIWVHADGELAGTLPVDITLVPSSFPLVIP